jgi:cell division protein FtsB
MSVALPLGAPLRRAAPADAGRHLEVVRAERPARRVSGMAVACASVAGLLALLFVLAVLQTAIAQGQAHLDHVGAQTADRHAEAQALRLEVAQLESPERIIEEAESRLGMVEPQTVTFVPAADPSQPPTLAPTEPTPAPADPEQAAETEIPPADPAAVELEAASAPVPPSPDVP